MSGKTTQQNILDGWEAIKLASIFDFKNGLNKEKKYFGQGTPIINYMDVNRGGGLYKDNIFGRVEVNKSELSRFNVKKGDVFFTRTSETLDEIGFSAVALDDFQDTVFSGFVLRARPKGEKLVPGYAQYCFKAQSARKEIMEKSSYTTRALTSGTSLNHVNINLPPLPEQKRIVAVLETWDRAVEKLQQEIKVKKDIKKGLMQELLTGKNRLAGFKDKWQEIRLGDMGKLVSGGTPSKLQDAYWNGEIPWISSSDVTENNIKYVNVHRYITPDAIKKSATSIVPPKSVVIVSRVGVGKVIVSEQDLCTSQDFQSLVVAENKGDAYFLAYLLMIKLRKLILRNQGTSIKGFLKKDLEDLVLVIPKVDEQVSIANLLNTSDEEIRKLEQKLSILKDQKKYLLNNLVTGTIRTPESLSIPK